MVDLRHRKNRPDLDIRDHAPTFIGGSACTIICQCGWSTKDYTSPPGAWHEFRQHKRTIRKPHLNQVGLSSSQEAQQ